METELLKLFSMLAGLIVDHGISSALFALGAVFATIAFALRRKSVSPMERRRSDYPRLRHILRDRIEMDHQINYALSILIRRLGCDRAYVNQYHNGGENICGVPFAKCSRTHERVRPGTPAQIASLQSLPNSVFAGANLVIIRDREIRLPDVETLRDSDPMGLYHSLKEQGIQGMYQIGMFSFDHVPIGVLGIDFCHGPMELTENELESLRASAMKLCGMLLSDQIQVDGYECASGCA